MQKKLGWGSVILLSIFLLGYFFIWPSDLQVTFKIKAIPGTVNQSIKLWANTLDNSEYLGQENLYNLSHKIQFNDSVYTYDWKIKSLNDSVSRVKVRVKDQNYSLSNKLRVPFAETDFEKRTKRTIKDLIDALQEHTKRFKITIIGVEKIPAKYGAYVSLESKQKDKALKMMQNYSFLTNMAAQKKLKLDGPPFIEVTNWNIEKDSIFFNFCNPIIKSDTLPQINGLLFKEFKERKAIKAIYNGNYITSDRAWYALLDYAKKNNLKVAEEPFEIFYNNPNIGGDELNWKAEVYLPLKE